MTDAEITTALAHIVPRLHQGSQLALYPYGENGRAAQRILRDKFQLTDVVLVDNYARGGDIRTLAAVQAQAQQWDFLLTSSDSCILYDTLTSLRGVVPREQIYVLQENSFFAYRPGEHRYLSHIGVLVTTFCNLRCRDCADCIPLRPNRHYDLAELQADYRKLLDAVEYIGEVLVIGGETLLYPQLCDALDFLRQQGKTDKIIITTNGTVFPQQELLDCIQRNRVTVRISGYPDSVAPHRAEIIQVFRPYAAAIEDLCDMEWLDVGDKRKRNRTTEEMKRVFGTCGMKNCVGIDTQGRIFCCSRHGTAFETDLYPTPDASEYVDLRTEQDVGAALDRLFALETLEVCDYCDGISCVTQRKIPVAVQM